MFARLNPQPEVQLSQVPVLGPAEMPDFSVLPLTLYTGISNQQAKINRLTQVAQQWSTEVPCQYNQATTHYNRDRITGKDRSI